MSKREKKTKCSRLVRRLTGRSLRHLVIGAGFPYHKSPHLYQWVWVFILLPFLEEDTLNELSEMHGKELRKLYDILSRHPEAFERLLRLLAMPLFFDILGELGAAGLSTQSRRRMRLIFDDTKSEKFGSCMEFLHKLFDSASDRYVMGYNYVLLLAVSGDTVIPLSFVLWLPRSHPGHRSKNDIARDEIIRLSKACDRRGASLSDVELLFDSAFCRQKVMNAGEAAGLRIITKPGGTHKFEFDGELLSPAEIIAKMKERDEWKHLEPGHDYQRVPARHHVYGEVVLVVRRRRQRNGKLVCDLVMCSKTFYNSVRIHKAYRKRWEIEMHFKYCKQHLSLGKAQFQKLGSVRSHISCVALAALVVALFRAQFRRRMSFRRAVKLLRRELWIL